jgi:hypothetical protein
MSLLPRIGEGVRAEVVIGEQLLFLFCTETGVGPAAALFNATTNQWVDRQWAADIDDGKKKAVDLAREFLARVGIPANTPFPDVEWKEIG